MFSIDGGRTLLIADVLAAEGRGSANCPTVAVTEDVPDPVALQEVLDDPNCFSFQELFPGGFTPQMGGTATDASLVAGVRGSTAGGLDWDLSGSAGTHGRRPARRRTARSRRRTPRSRRPSRPWPPPVSRW